MAGREAAALHHWVRWGQNLHVDDSAAALGPRLDGVLLALSEVDDELLDRELEMRVNSGGVHSPDCSGGAGRRAQVRDLTGAEVCGCLRAAVGTAGWREELAVLASLRLHGIRDAWDLLAVSGLFARRHRLTTAPSRAAELSARCSAAWADLTDALVAAGRGRAHELVPGSDALHRAAVTTALRGTGSPIANALADQSHEDAASWLRQYAAGLQPKFERPAALDLLDEVELIEVPMGTSPTDWLLAPFRSTVAQVANHRQRLTVRVPEHVLYELVCWLGGERENGPEVTAVQAPALAVIHDGDVLAHLTDSLTRRQAATVCQLWLPSQRGTLYGGRDAALNAARGLAA